MDHDHLYTIGSLAKVTGTKVKALRYYEKIGILLPTYINPDNGYRYYSHKHIYLIGAIRLCAELNIPLSEFKQFVSQSDEEIYLSSLVTTGIEKAKVKINELQKLLSLLEKTQEDINKFEETQNKHIKNKIPQKSYWLIPYNGLINTREFYFAIADAYAQINKNQLIVDDYTEEGILMIDDGKNQDSFIYLELVENDRNNEFKNVMTINENYYLSSITESNNINDVRYIYSDLFQQEYYKIILLREPLTEIYHAGKPLFQLDCLLP